MTMSAPSTQGLITQGRCLSCSPPLAFWVIPACCEDAQEREANSAINPNAQHNSFPAMAYLLDTFTQMGNCKVSALILVSLSLSPSPLSLCLSLSLSLFLFSLPLHTHPVSL